MLGDYLADDGIHHVRGQVTFDENSNINWSKSTSSTTNLNAFWFVKSVYPNLNIKENSYIKLSDYFLYKNEEWKTVTAPCLCENSGLLPNMIIFGGLSDITTVEEWMIFLQAHPVTVEYELEQEVIVPYTSAQQEVYNQIKQALSYEEQTNISSNTIALFNVEAYQSTKLLLENFESRLTLVEG